MKHILTFILLTISVASFGQNTQLDTIPKSANILATMDTTITDLQFELVKNNYWNDIKPQGWITYFEKLFTEEEIKQLDSVLVNFEKATSIEIAVVTVDTNYIQARYFDDFALFIARNWKVGKKNKDNGILIAISKVHKRIRICNGYGIEETLTDDETKTIIDKSFTPYFKAGKYFDGTACGINALIAHLQKP